MLSLHRVAYDARSGAAFVLREYVHSRCRVRLQRTVGATIDERLFYPVTAWSGPAARPQLLIPLEGRERCHENGVSRWLEPGSFVIGSALEALYARMEPDTLTLSIDWTLGSLGTSCPSGLPTAPLGRRARERLSSSAARLLQEDAPDPANEVADILALLRGEGLPFDRVDAADLAESVEPQDEAIARALSTSLSSLAHNPMSVDLEQILGLSRRRVTELVAHFSARFGLNGADWRTIRDRWRLVAGAVLASHPRARTEDVASAVGYGSARAFCHAVHRAGLPSPGNTRRALDALL